MGALFLLSWCSLCCIYTIVNLGWSSSWLCGFLRSTSLEIQYQIGIGWPSPFLILAYCDDGLCAIIWWRTDGSSKRMCVLFAFSADLYQIVDLRNVMWFILQVFVIFYSVYSSFSPNGLHVCVLCLSVYFSYLWSPAGPYGSVLCSYVLSMMGWQAYQSPTGWHIILLELYVIIIYFNIIFLS